MTDPTLMRNQASLTTSRGRIWLVVGGLLALVAVVVLAALGQWIGVSVIVVLYAAMIVVRVAVAGRVRLLLLAALMIAIAVVALAWVLVVTTGATSAV